jgi:hypothetical protein
VLPLLLLLLPVTQACSKHLLYCFQTGHQHSIMCASSCNTCQARTCGDLTSYDQCCTSASGTECICAHARNVFLTTTATEWCLDPISM